MGNRFSRRRDVPAEAAAAPEQKTSAEPAASQPAEGSAIMQTQEVVGEAVAQVAEACLPSEECVSECKEAAPAPAPAPAPTPAEEPEPEPVAKEDPVPAEPEPLVSVCEPPPPEPEPVVEALLAPEPVPEPVPEPEEEVEPVPEPVSESAQAPPEAEEPQTDMLTEEPLLEPEISSPALIDLGIPDVTPEPINADPSPDPIPAPVDVAEPSDIPVPEESQDSAEVPVISPPELEEPEESSESLEKPTEVEVEATGDLEQHVSDVNDSVSELLQNLELKGSDLVADLIPTDDIMIPDGTPITVMSTTADLM